MLSLRLGADEEIVSSILAAFDVADAEGGAVTSAIGSLKHLAFVVVDVNEDDAPVYSEPIELFEPIELTGLQGHVGRHQDGAASSHLHGNFAVKGGASLGGHLISATVLVTVEITILLPDGLSWCRDREFFMNGQEMPILLPCASSKHRSRDRSQEETIPSFSRKAGS